MVELIIKASFLEVIKIPIIDKVLKIKPKNKTGMQSGPEAL